MKKVLFAILLSVFCLTGAYAESKDAIFDRLYNGTVAQLPPGVTAGKSADYRIMFINYPLEISSRSGFDVIAAKRAIVNVIRNTVDADYIRRSDAMIIYNYITTDRKVYSVVITDADL